MTFKKEGFNRAKKYSINIELFKKIVLVLTILRKKRFKGIRHMLITRSFLLLYNNRKHRSRTPVQFNRPQQLLDKRDDKAEPQ
jgi:hypothetical protein